MVKWRGEIQKEAGAMPKKTTLKGQFLRTSLAMLVLSLLIGVAVSYTHLDVYKRQL